MARAKLSFSAPITVPLDCLERSEGNVRRIRPAIPIQSLADSIARRGLLQSLSVRPVLDEAGAETGRYRVQAGGRRLEALQQLVKQKRLAKNATIPCLVKTSGLEEEDSLAENTDREALHPLDQYRAFAALAEKGQGIEDIAASFSVTPAVVRQRLKLASVSPKLLALYEEDALTLDLLMAFALSADQARQEQVWEAIQQRNWHQTPHHIRRLLTENTISARDASVRFVGIEAYEAAGGFVMRDLFEEDGGGYLTDPLLLQKLVNEKLDAAAETVRAEGWKWVEAAEDIPYNATYGLRPLVPMANAVGSASTRGQQAPSQQGLAGLRLQHALPQARVVYISATGATTVQNLGYAQRLGLWGGTDFPFATRADFIQALEAGGIAAMEVLARDLKALGLYTARSLSYEGVEVAILEHALTTEQVRIYDAFASAFQIIHQNLTAALEAANITGSEGTLNKQAKSAAKSAFESNKQRFFNHLITAMKVPSLLKAVASDLADGHAAIVQLVSTAESLMERRLSEIPTEEWGDLSLDLTPKEYVLDYLNHGFPTQLYERYSDEDGNIRSRPVVLDGQPVHSKEAIARRDALIDKLASLPAVPSALDQIVQHFGTDRVAEVTGRSRRIVRKLDSHGQPILQVENRPCMLDDFAVARLGNGVDRLMRKVTKVSVLILDDWAMIDLTAAQRRDLMEIVDDRHDRGSIILASQLPVESWHATIGDPTYADAILDRVVHNAIRLPLKGESRRKPETSGGASIDGDAKIDAKT